MRAEYDFSAGKRGVVLRYKKKARVSVYIDNAVLDQLRARAEKAGTGYQTMINDALRAYLSETAMPTDEGLRRPAKQFGSSLYVGQRTRDRSDL